MATPHNSHAATASEFFRKLYDEGKFIEKTSMQYYDEEIGRASCRERV